MASRSKSSLKPPNLHHPFLLPSLYVPQTLKLRLLNPPTHSFFCICIQLKQQFANNDNIQNLIDAFTQWGQQHDGLAQVVHRANDFFDPARIGAGDQVKRSKTDYCPAKVEDLLQYADDSDPDSEDIR